MYKTGYQNDINQLKRKYIDGYNIAKDICADVNIYSFVSTLRKELSDTEVKVSAIIRSNAHPSDELRIRYFALRQLIDQLDTWSKPKPCYVTD